VHYDTTPLKTSFAGGNSGTASPKPTKQPPRMSLLDLDITKTVDFLYVLRLGIKQVAEKAQSAGAYLKPDSAQACLKEIQAESLTLTGQKGWFGVGETLPKDTDTQLEGLRVITTYTI